MKNRTKTALLVLLALGALAACGQQAEPDSTGSTKPSIVQPGAFEIVQPGDKITVLVDPAGHAPETLALTVGTGQAALEVDGAMLRAVVSVPDNTPDGDTITVSVSVSVSVPVRNPCFPSPSFPPTLSVRRCATSFSIETCAPVAVIPTTWRRSGGWRSCPRRSVWLSCRSSFGCSRTPIRRGGESHCAVSPACGAKPSKRP